MSRKMKDSRIEWLGEIPFSWNLTKYKYFATSGMGSTLLKKDILIKQEEDSVPIYSATQTDKHFGYLKNPSIVLGKGDLIIPARGNSIGNTKIINQGNATCTQTTIYSKVNDRINSKFLYYCSKGLQKYWFFYVQTAIPQITVDEVQNNLVPYPSNLEQGRIVNFLDKKTSEIDNILEKTRQSIEELKAYKQSLITETVTKGLNPDAPMKDSGIEWIDKIPENWRIGKLKYFSSVNDESLSNKTSLDYKFKYIDIGSVSLEKGIVNYEKTNFKDAPSRARRIVKDNDIIISTVRTYLKAIAVIRDSKDMIVSTGFAVIRPKRIKSNFLSYYLKSDIFTERVSQLSEGIAYPSIASEKLINIKIIVPDEKSQLEIGEFLDIRTQQIDTLINKKHQMIKELESYKQSLIYEYVTGKKEVE